MTYVDFSKTPQERAYAQQGAPLMSFPEFIWEGRLDREFIPYL